MRIPGANLKAQYDPIRDEVIEAFTRLLETTQFVQGPDVKAFEDEFASYCEVKHAIGVANGTEALMLALRAVGVGPDDAVLVPDWTFAATIESVCHVGARPVLVDIDPDTFNISPEGIASALDCFGDRVKAILPVHLYGRPAAMDEILAHADRAGVPVIEDAAQAHGARYKGKRPGGFGRLGCFSFYPTKNLGAAGDGGMITTNDDALATHLRQMCDHGQTGKYEHGFVGFNSRLDSIQAAILRAKLPFLDGWNARRREIARLYGERLASRPEVRLAAPPGDAELVHHLFVVRCERRNELQRHLAAAGIASAIHYPRAVHQQPAFSAYGDDATYPHATRAATEVLALPCYPELTDASVGEVCDAIDAFYTETP